MQVGHGDPELGECRVGGGNMVRAGCHRAPALSMPALSLLVRSAWTSQTRLADPEVGSDLLHVLPGFTVPGGSHDIVAELSQNSCPGR